MNIRRNLHSCCSSTLITIVLILYNLSLICDSKQTNTALDLDMMYSDTSHEPTAAAAHQQVVFIDHGGGAISHIRRTSYLPNPSLPSVPSLPFRSHVNHYPNSLYENNFADEPYVNAFPDDIPRIHDRHNTPINTPNPALHQHHNPSPYPFIGHDPRQQPPPQPQSLPQPIHPQVIHQQFPQHITQPIPQPMLPPIQHSNLQHISHPQFIQHPVVQPIPQPMPQPVPHYNPNPTPYPMSQPIRHSIDTDIENERYLINNEIERIPKPSNDVKPTRREPPPPPPPQPSPQPSPPPTLVSEQPINNPFFNFAEGPELFNFESPFDTFSPQNVPNFQRRRLTTNNNVNDLNHNSIGYPSYTYYKGGGDDNPSLTNWPKIFKFTDGRSNLYDFEKQKKQNKIKFNSKETYFDHISRDSFLILHGGTFAQ